MLNVSVLCFTFWNCSLENVGNGIFKPLKIKIPCRGGGGGGGGGVISSNPAYGSRLRRSIHFLLRAYSMQNVGYAPGPPHFARSAVPLKPGLLCYFIGTLLFFFSTEISWIKIQIRGGGTAGGVFYSVCLVTSLQIINALLEPRSHPALPSRVRGNWVLVNQPNHGAAGTHQ